MNRLYQLIFIAFLLINTTYSQGSRGGGGSSGGSGSRGSSQSRSGSGCSGEECTRNGIIAGSVIGGIFGIIAIVLAVFCIYRRYNGKPKHSNRSFIDQTNKTRNPYHINVFQDGTWSSRYHQYKKWHGPHNATLKFDRENGQVTGSGTDDIGRYTVDGIFSERTNRVSLQKKYVAGTGNVRENRGHLVTIQLTWDVETKQFEGKWYIQNKHYRGEDKIEYKLNDVHLSKTGDSSFPMYSADDKY